MSFHYLLSNYLDIFHHLPIFMVSGLIVTLGYYGGKLSQNVKLPSIIGYMLIGLLLGPSIMDILTPELQNSFSFVTDLALAFVAISIGMELDLQILLGKGSGIIAVIICESFGAFILTFTGIYLLSKNLPMSLIFASFAPASAPAGTVAVINEYKAKGSLTKALYAVVGFDDGLAIIIFGFASAMARSILLQDSQLSPTGSSLLANLLTPCYEIAISLFVGFVMAIIFKMLARPNKNESELLTISFGLIMIANGLCVAFHLSVILTNMIVGLVIANTGGRELEKKLAGILTRVMPFIFVMFFVLAGSNLHLGALPALGALGIVYITCRTIGLISGARLGASIGKVDEKIKKYIGLGILSQAGVAIGLAIIVKNEFQGIGPMVQDISGHYVHLGDQIGSIGLTTITATCVFFEIIGPILTKVALSKAGEIKAE